MLQAVASTPTARNRDLAEQLGTDETQISRAGRQLTDLGLLVRFKRGRENRWVVSPRGQIAIAELTSNEGTQDVDVEGLFDTIVASSARDGQQASVAMELVVLGVAQRQSTLTRGSLFHPAPPRLTPTTEAVLVDRVEEAKGEVQAALILVLGEWGSEEAALALAKRLQDAPPASNPTSIVSALRRLGGLCSAEALCAVIEHWRPGDQRELLQAAIDAVAELVSGGRDDVTAHVSEAEPSSRWRTNEIDRAAALLERLQSALATVEEADDLPRYTRSSSAQTRRDLRAWARANDLRLPSSDEVLAPGEVAEILGDAFFTATAAAAATLAGAADHRATSSDHVLRSQLKRFFQELLIQSEGVRDAPPSAAAVGDRAFRPARSPSLGGQKKRVLPGVSALTEADSVARDEILAAALQVVPVPQQDSVRSKD